MVNCNATPTQSIKIIFFILLPEFFYSFYFSLIRSTIHHHNLQSCRSSCLSTVQTSLGWRRSTSSKLGGAPDCCRSRQNSIIRFAKPDSPVSTVLSRSLRFLFISCGNNGMCVNLIPGHTYYEHSVWP
jgi:hypothetical protein